MGKLLGVLVLACRNLWEKSIVSGDLRLGYAVGWPGAGSALVAWELCKDKGLRVKDKVVLLGR